MQEFEGRLGHIVNIESPWANAGGVVKTVDDVHVMAQTGVGWIEDGSQTLEPRLGNAVDPQNLAAGAIRKVYFHDPVTGLTFNSLGMPNKGIDIWSEEIPEKVRIAESHGKAFVQNVAPVSEDPVVESVELVTRAYEKGAHAVLLNAGCPNVVTADGGRHEILSHNPEALQEVLQALKPITERFFPIFIRVSPLEDVTIAREVARNILLSQAVSVVFTPNTWPNFAPTDVHGEHILEVPGGMGGKSGPGTAPEARNQARLYAELSAHLESSVDIVVSGGITNPQSLKKGLSIPKVVGAAGTTFFYESQNGWAADTDKLLTDYANL